MKTNSRIKATTKANRATEIEANIQGAAEIQATTDAPYASMMREVEKISRVLDFGALKDFYGISGRS